MHLHDINTDINTVLNIDGYSQWIYREEGVIYYRYDQATNINNYYYQPFSGGMEQLLISGGWINFFDTDSGNYVYGIWDSTT